MNQEIMPAYAAYQKAIDLTLYHAFAELVVQTSQDDKARMHYRQIEAAQIWQQDVDVSIYFEQYSLRYPGEVLERFEEKLGTDIRIVRALALALAVTRTLHADQMFVGSQRSGFLQKIRRIAGCVPERCSVSSGGRYCAPACPVGCPGKDGIHQDRRSLVCPFSV